MKQADSVDLSDDILAAQECSSYEEVGLLTLRSYDETVLKSLRVPLARVSYIRHYFFHRLALSQ